MIACGNKAHTAKAAHHLTTDDVRACFLLDGIATVEELDARAAQAAAETAEDVWAAESRAAEAAFFETDPQIAAYGDRLRAEAEDWEWAAERAASLGPLDGYEDAHYQRYADAGFWGRDA